MAHLAPMTDAYKKLDETDKAVDVAVREHAIAYAEEVEARSAVARQLEIDEAELMKKFGKGRRLESFFIRREDSPRKTEEGDGGGEGK